MEKKSLGVNTILNVIKSVLSILFPLITYPYVLRVLGEDGIGKVSYSASIINYFSLIAMLGVATYGVREGAKRRTNQKELQRFISEVYTINICSTIFAYVLLFITIVFLDKLHSYAKLLVLQSLSILLTTMGADWINTIFEDFFLITVRSILTYGLSVVFLFIFVRTPEDYYWYAFLTVLTNAVVCVSNWFYVQKYVKLYITCKPKISIHLPPLLLLFVSAIAISVYVNFDITMLGWLKGDYIVGLYSVAVKIYTIIKTMAAAVYAVLIPRLAAYFGENRKGDYKKLYTNLWCGLSLLLIPSAVGLLCTSEEIMIIMGGERYAVTAPTLQILSVSLVFAVWGGLITGVHNIIVGKERDNLFATIFAALINCGLNLIFIPLFNQNGAAFTTVFSEAFVCLFCFMRIEYREEYLDGLKLARILRDAVIGSVIIFVFVCIIRSWIRNIILRLSISILGSIFLYIVTLLVLKNSYIIDGLSSIKRFQRKNG